jgi:hypothetical protein
MPQNQYDQILAIPINEDSKPIQFSTKQLHLCQHMNSLFVCDLEHSDECNLNLTEHQINYQAYYQPIPVIELLSISSVNNHTRKYYPKTQTIIKLVAFCILIFLSIISAIRAIFNGVNRPRLIQLPL